MLVNEKYTSGEYYHVYNRNLSGLKTLKNGENCHRFLELMRFYQLFETPCSYSQLLDHTKRSKTSIECFMEYGNAGHKKWVEITAYCLMPNHFHFILHQIEDNGISVFLNNVLNGFSRYYNLKNDRKGTLWIGRTKNVHIKNDAHLLEESRYIHRNPVKAGLAKKPSDWSYSSYGEYIGTADPQKRLCNTSIILESDLGNYKNFVEMDL